MAATRIIGIDPGLNRTGWGVIESEGNRLRHIADGRIVTDAALPLAERLTTIHGELAKLLAIWSPDEAAVEEVFVNKNPASTIKLGMARGVALLAPALAGLPVAEYAANLVKKSVVGTGHADKAQIAMMIKVLLPGATATADAADALAVAICHAHHRAAPGSAARSTGTDGGAYRSKPSASQIANARRLRVDSTNVEQILWRSLRDRQLGVKFRRQAPVLNYVADFLSNDARLIVELDGGQHAESIADDRRTKSLEQAGFRVIRFWNNEVCDNLDGVLQTIADAVTARPTPRPDGEREGPAQREGEGAAPHG